MELELAAVVALIQVMLINAVLSADNAMVIALASVGLPPRQRSIAVWGGIALATVLLALFAVIATTLLKILGLLLAGGVLLLWVSWKLWRDIAASHVDPSLGPGAHQPEKTLWQALKQILLADISMSLDNVLAVAGAAREHPTVMVVGLGVSVVLRGLAATVLARLLGRYPWLAYVGLAVIVYVALHMIWSGAHDVWAAV